MSITAQLVSIELGKAKQKFSSAHFTMFSATERENLHGHNFHVVVRGTAVLDEYGICFDLQILKDAITAQCGQWNERTLLPGASPWLKIAADADYLTARFDGADLRFLHRDVLLLPARNGSLEEFARVFLDGLVASPEHDWAALGLRELEVAISTEPGQYSGIRRALPAPSPSLSASAGSA